MPDAGLVAAARTEPAEPPLAWRPAPVAGALGPLAARSPLPPQPAAPLPDGLRSTRMLCLDADLANPSTTCAEHQHSPQEEARSVGPLQIRGKLPKLPGPRCGWRRAHFVWANQGTRLCQAILGTDVRVCVPASPRLCLGVFWKEREVEVVRSACHHRTLDDRQGNIAPKPSGQKKIT
jgi:hypothetical protein